VVAAMKVGVGSGSEFLAKFEPVVEFFDHHREVVLQIAGRGPVARGPPSSCQA
jgi:hypothetical protein